MVTMEVFPFKEKSSWQNWKSNPGPHDQYSETLTTRPRGCSNETEYKNGTYIIIKYLT
jgi:hypothetical protein